MRGKIRARFLLASFMIFVSTAGSHVSPVFAGPDSGVDVVMVVQAVNFEFLGGTNFNVDVAVAQNEVRPRIIIKNTGSASQDYALRVSNSTGASWTLVTGTPGADQYRLSAVWHQWDVTPATSEFQSNDVLTLSDQKSSASEFFNDSETHGNNSDNVGYNVPVNGERNLFVWVQGPSSGSGSLTATIGMTIFLSP